MVLTKENAQNFLHTRFNFEVTNLTPISQGEWSQAYFFKAGENFKVIRFSQLDEDFKKDQFAFNFASDRLPIPKVEEIGQAFGGYYAITPKIEGKMIDDLDSAEMTQALPSLFDLFDSLRVADISRTSGYGGWDTQGVGRENSWRRFLENIAHDDSTSRFDWRPKLESRPDTLSLFNSVYQEMLKLTEFCPDERHLIHNDLLHFNLLVNNNKVVGVIDWGCSLYGDFLYDLALFDFWQFYFPQMKGIDFKGDAKKYFGEKGVTLTDFEKRLKCYQCHLALDSMKYNVFKDNDKNLQLTTSRIKEIIK